VENCGGTAETFEVTIDECVGVEEITKGDISVFPNPANNTLNISFGNIGSSTIELTMFDARGKLALSKTINTESGSTTKFDISNLPQAVYFMQLKTDGVLINTLKVLITR
jgi:hypothetical protein